MTVSLEHFNSNQRAAVLWNQGPLLVLAGPGSGKTQVLTMRVIRLLDESPEQRFRVLGLTFTNKAAAEMRSRVEQALPDCGHRVLLTTFHSFCADILRQHGNHVGLKPDFTILSQDADRESVLEDAVDALLAAGVDIDDRNARMIAVIDSLQSKLVPEESVELLFKDKEFGIQISRLYKEYNKQLLINNRLDFASLLIMTYKLLIEKPFIAKQIRKIYTHLCVDEFQDTNLAQYRIMKLIAGEASTNLFVVADDDQIIYQWNGASPERLQDLIEDYHMSIIQLPANYRCPSEVISLANKLITHNLTRSANKEPLQSMKNEECKDSVKLFEFNSMNEELYWVAKDIEVRHRDELGTCVILGRSRKLLTEVKEQLEQIGIKAYLATRKAEFTSAPLRWLHAILRLANGRGEREQLRRVCKSFYELEGAYLEVKEIVVAASHVGGDYLKAWVEMAIQHESVGVVTRTFLTSASLSLVDRMDYVNFLQGAYDWFRRLESEIGGPSRERFADFEEELKTWMDLLSDARLKYGSDSLTLNIFLQEMDLSEKSPPMPSDSVKCLTIHGAKGLEFDNVYLIGLAEELLPSFQSITKGDDSKEMQEERRNCFVAITRTQKSLTMTYARNYFGWAKKPSRFLSEMELSPAIDN